MRPVKRKTWKSGQMSCREVRFTMVCIRDAFIEKEIYIQHVKKCDSSNGKDNSAMTKGD